MEEHEKLLKLFNSNSKNGTIDHVRFALMVASLSKKYSSLKHLKVEVFYAIFSYIDVNCDGFISFNEFISWWEEYKYRFEILHERHLVEAYSIYRSYTPVGSHGMTKSQFEMFLTDNNTLSRGTIDSNQDGLISFKEFFDWLDW